MSAASSGGGAWGGLALLVRRSLRQHALSTFVTVCSAALASGLVMAVFSINAQTYKAFAGGPLGFDAVLGARGSQLQLVLNTVFHLETSPGNLPWTAYTAIRKDPRVAWAIPYVVGDNYAGFRVVGTTDEIFSKFEYEKGRKFQFPAGGRPFDSARREAVIGSYVAQKTGLRVGAEFQPAHDVVEQGGHVHEEHYVVVGVLKPTNTPADRVIWIPLEGMYRMSGHVLRGGGQEYHARHDEDVPDEHKEVSAVVLKFHSDEAGFLLDQTINKREKNATLAWPVGAAMADLFDKLGWVNRILTLVSYLVVAVAAGSILAAVYNSINERRREFAILRALGARRTTVFSAIVLEAAAIAGLGALVGFLVYAAILAAATVLIRAQTGVVLDALQFHWALALTPPGMAALGALAGVVPALKAYATDVATNLTPAS